MYLQIFAHISVISLRNCMVVDKTKASGMFSA